MPYEVNMAYAGIAAGARSRNCFDASKGSDPNLAVSLFAERTARKPHSAWGWEHYADCLVAAGQGDRAKTARETARGLAER